jgi:hypothetical protein
VADFLLGYQPKRFLKLSQVQLGVPSAVLLLNVVNDWGCSWWLSFEPCLLKGNLTGSSAWSSGSCGAGPATSHQDVVMNALCTFWQSVDDPGQIGTILIQGEVL